MAIVDELAQLGDEATFRERFVIPLLYRLGFSMVVNYHGAREFGRDIIFGEFDRFDHPVYYGLQAKYVPSLGQAESHGLAMDAREAFAHEFQHPQRHVRQQVCRFYGVNAGTISDNARENFFQQLDKTQAANSVLLDGGALVSLGRRTAFTRAVLAREQMLGLSFELKVNRATDLEPKLKKYLEDGTYPMVRFRLAATLAMLERPVITDPQFMGDLHDYWHYSRSVNQIVDSLDVVFNVTQRNEQRCQAAVELLGRLQGLSDKLEKRILELVAESARGGV